MTTSVDSRTKYLNLVKQLTGIDFEITKGTEGENQKVINKLSSEEVVILRDSSQSNSQRVNKRLQIIEARQQYNLEQIFSLALEHVKEDVVLERLDLDWVMKFSELAKTCYTQTMHELWAKIFSIELVQQGSFSYRSLKTLSELGNKEAKTFYKAVRMMSKFNNEHSGRILTGFYQKPTLMNIFSSPGKVTFNLNQFGLSYAHLISLVELGLIHQQEIESGAFKANDVIKVSQNQQDFQVLIKQKDVVFTYYKLTPSGYELSNLVHSTEDSHFIDYLLSEFSDIFANDNQIVTKA